MFLVYPIVFVHKNGLFLHGLLKFFAYSQNYSDQLVHNNKKEILMRKLIGFMKNEDGATAIEYGLIASLIAVAVVGILVTLGPKIAATFQKVQDSMPN